MTTPPNAASGARTEGHGTNSERTAMRGAEIRPLYWSIRRELWENRSIYVVPLCAAAVGTLAFFINLFYLPSTMRGVPMHHAPTSMSAMLAMPYAHLDWLLIPTLFIVGVFYSLDALHGERRDRSILFWKSLPVSDLTVVLSKVAIPAVVLPFVCLVISVATQLVMLVLSSVVFAGSGIDIAKLWTDASFFRVSAVMLYHIITVHGLWYAPIYGWLLLVSAWAPRAPFLWAFLPPFVISGVERLAFNSTHFLAMLEHRLEGPAQSTEHATSMATSGAPMDHNPLSFLIPSHFFSEPGLWIGLAVAAVFVFVAVRLRRYRGPI